MTASPTVETLDPCRMAEADAAACGRLLQSVWPVAAAAVPDEPAWHGRPAWKPARLVIRLPGGQVGAHARLFAREIATARGRETVMGLAGVCVREDLRGRGWGRLVARAALARVDAGDFAWALFQTAKPGFYAKLGCGSINNPIVNSLSADPEARAFWDPYSIAYPDQSAPDGTIDLLGPGY